MFEAERPVSRKKINPIIRFFAKVSVMPSGCWEWQAYRTQDGYGQFWNGDGQSLAHRWSYQHHIGPIPSNLVIDHLCRNPQCVNPSHLECVTMKTNTERGVLYQVFAAKAAVLTHCKRGHELAGDNLIIDQRGDRGCKACQRSKANEWKVANRDRVNQLQRIRRANGHR